MRHMKQTTLWLCTFLVVMGLVLPGSAVAETRAPQSSDVTSAGIRFHSSGWLDAVPAAERATAFDRVNAWIEQRQANVAKRPPVDPAVQANTTAAWTVMVFMAADNNLEQAALGDINELEAVGSSPDVNILVEIDRSEEYTDIDGDWTDGRRYLIQQDDDLEEINSTVVEKLGETNSGDPNAIADFAVWAIQNYPAEKYAFIMWDHGGAWIMHSSDEDSGDSVNLPETVEALDRIKAETGIDQFELLGFDMCLMGQLEVMQTIAPYARYAFGSEELVPGPGMFYFFLDELVKNPGMDGKQLSGHIVDYYMQFYDELWTYADFYGLTAVDLGQLTVMKTAIDQFAAAIDTNPQAALSALADARNNTLAYGGYDDPQVYDIFSSVDLYRFAELFTDISTVPAMQQAAQGVIDSFDSVVIAEAHNEGLDGSHGMAIYFPRTIKAYRKNDFFKKYPAQVPATMASWIRFLDVYHGTAATTVTSAPNVEVLSVFPEVASIYQPAVVSLDISGRDILQVNYAVTYIISENERAVLDFDYLVSRTTTIGGADIVNWSDGVTTRTFTWEAEVPKLTDGTVSTYALLIPNRDDPNVAIVNGEYTSVRGEDPLNAQLVFDLNERKSTSLWGLSETADGALQPFEVKIQDGDTFRPLWLTMDANNELTSSSFGDTLTLSSTTPITFEKVPAPTGQYSISFVAENVAGEKTLDEALIQVSNDNLAPNLRGYTDLAYGVNFLYPSSWIRPRFTPDGKRLFTADLTTNTILSLFPYTEVTSAEETAAAVRESWSQLQNLQVSNERQAEINGLSAYIADYTYTFDGEARVGAVIAIYVPSQNVGYGFDLDAPAAIPGPAQEALAALIDSINFFEPQQATGQSAWQTVTLADGKVSFPVPADWIQAISGNWTLYGPANIPAIFAGLTWAAASGQSNQALAEYWVSQLQTNRQNLEILASQPYYVGSSEWYLVVFRYEADVKMGGAFFAISSGGQDYVFWLEAPDAEFDQLYAEVFSVAIGGFTFNG